MSSVDFNIDSLLDDINDADFMTPRGGSDYSASKHVPHPPKAEKSPVHVFSTNPKSKFAVFPISSSSPTSSRQSDLTYYDSNSCGYFGDETSCRGSSKPQKQSTNSYMDKKNDRDYNDKFATHDSPRSQLKGNGTASYSKSQQNNDTSVDRLLSMLSKSQSPPETPISTRAYSNKYSDEGTAKDNRPSQGAFGASCSLSRGAGEQAQEHRHDSHYSRQRPPYLSTEPKAAMCDDFDDEEDDMRTDRRGRRDRDNERSADSPVSVGSFKRVPTVQRLEDMEHNGGENSNSNSNNISYSNSNGNINNGSNSRGKDSSRFGSNSSYSDNSSRGTSQSQSQPLFRSSAKSGSGDRPDSAHSDRAKGAMSYQSSSAREENDWDRAPGITRGVLSSSLSSSSSTGRAGYSAEQEHTHTRLPHTALSNSTYPLTTPSKGSSSSSSISRGSGAGTQSSLAPSMGTAPTGTKARCTRIVLSGSSSARGLRSSVFSKCACDNLRCLSCNFKVHIFVGSAWRTGPSVDYMFFRNNTPNEAKLSAQLERSAAQCAYCCQCSWTQTAGERTLSQGVSGDPQWICAGH